MAAVERYPDAIFSQRFRASRACAHTLSRKVVRVSARDATEMGHAAHGLSDNFGLSAGIALPRILRAALPQSLSADGNVAVGQRAGLRMVAHDLPQLLCSHPHAGGRMVFRPNLRAHAFTAS